jgi:hypothetical protein
MISSGSSFWAVARGSDFSFLGEMLMALLLFVRAMDDVMPAVEAASEFLSHRQQQLEGSRQSDDLLGIWIDRDLEAALPASSIPSLHSSSERPTTTVRLDNSVSLSGIWTLCWIDLSTPESRLGGNSPREVLIGAVAEVFSERHSSTGAGLLLPVFGAGDPTEGIDASIADLKSRYPGLIGTAWFIHDRNQGKIVRAEHAVGLRQ